MTLANELTLNDGASIPQLGMGTVRIPFEELPRVLADAVSLGYRHFDTATHYGNEAVVGASLAAIDAVSRDDLFVVTKLPNAKHGYDNALRAFDRSEQALGRIDLYVMHWPQPPKGLYLDTWRAMVRLREEGRVRSIGVGSFPEALLDELIAETGVTPAVNLVELHPAFQQVQLRAANEQRGIRTVSWSPLGKGQSLSNPVLDEIARRLRTTPAAVILRWHLDLGLIAIPRSSRRDHLAENFSSLSLSLTPEDHAAIAALDQPDGRFGPEPMTHTTEQGA